MKMWLWIFRNCDEIMQKRFYQDDINVKSHNSKICMAYLKLCNIKIPDKLANKRDAIRDNELFGSPIFSSIDITFEVVREDAEPDTLEDLNNSMRQIQKKKSFHCTEV